MPAQNWADAWRSGLRSAKVATFTLGPGFTLARGLGSAGLFELSFPVQPIRARAALSRAVRGCARVSRCVAAVRRPLPVWGCWAAIACRAAASREAGSFAGWGAAAAVLVVRVISIWVVRVGDAVGVACF